MQRQAATEVVSPAMARADAPLPAPPMAPAAVPNEDAANRPMPVREEIFSEPLTLDRVAGRAPAHLERAERILRTTLAEGRWREYAELLRRSLALELKKSRGFSQPNAYDPFLGNPLFQTAMLQHALIATLPEDARSMIRSAESDREFYLWLLTTPAALEEWLIHARPEDDLKDALRTWAQTQAEDPEAREKYRSLAIACALVFDKEFKPEWNGERLDLSAALRYHYYRTQDGKGELAAPLKQLSVADLVWVVCAPVPDSELDWARKKLRLKQRTWGASYGMVPYDMERAVTGKQKKPYDRYLFSEILEKGGICGDRTYFGVNSARALGIPAAPLSGDGPLGSHAWMAWKADDHEWKTTGRLAGYGAGTTRSPQTGRRLSEMEFTRLSDRRANSPALTAKAHRVLWLAQLHSALGESASADNAIEFALATNRGSSEFWLAKLAHWKKAHREAPVAEWAKFVDQWKREFPNDSELLAEARRIEEELIFPRQDAKTALREMRQDARGLDRVRPDDGPPLTAGDVAATFQRQATLLKAARDYVGIRAIYHKAFRQHGEDPAAFKKMARDYFGLVREDRTAALDACREIESSFEKYVETRDTFWFAVKGQNSAAEVVAQCWREAGDGAKADRLLKEAEKREKKSKRTAI